MREPQVTSNNLIDLGLSLSPKFKKPICQAKKQNALTNVYLYVII